MGQDQIGMLCDLGLPILLEWSTSFEPWAPISDSNQLANYITQRLLSPAAQSLIARAKAQQHQTHSH